MFSAVVNGLGDLATDAFGYHNDAPTNAGLAATLHTYSYERATRNGILWRERKRSRHAWEV